MRETRRKKKRKKRLRWKRLDAASCFGSRPWCTSAAHVSLAICQGRLDQDGSPPITSSRHPRRHSSVCISLLPKDHGCLLPGEWPRLYLTGASSADPAALRLYSRKFYWPLSLHCVCHRETAKNTAYMFNAATVTWVFKSFIKTCSKTLFSV